MKTLKSAALMTVLILLAATSSFARMGSYYVHALGSGELKEGVCTVTLEGLPEGYHVILTPLGACGQLYISEKAADKFVVKENFIGEKGSTIKFDYVILADRLTGGSFDNTRMEEMRKKYEEMDDSRRQEIQNRIDEIKQGSSEEEETTPEESDTPSVDE